MRGDGNGKKLHFVLTEMKAVHEMMWNHKQVMKNKDEFIVQ
jgi:hypothetical protein